MRPAVASLLPALVLSSSCLVLDACQAPTSAPKRAITQEQDEGLPMPEAVERPTMTAAGLSLKLPEAWEVFDSSDANFAMASAPEPIGTQTFGCVIEVRRQGRGELSRAAKPTKTSTPTDLRYNQGPLHGRLREFPGPSADAVVLVHCRGPRSSSDWGPIDAAIDALAPAGAATLLPRPEQPAATAIAELCVGSPARKTYVCARRQDGAVLCGTSGSEQLTPIAELGASVQLGCDGARSCSRDAEGQVSCWKAGQPAAPVPELGKVSELAGGCAVREDGGVWCRARREDGMTLDSFAELVPLGDAAHALQGASQVLAGSTSNSGCVVAGGELRCWDAIGELGLALEGLDAAPQRVAEVGEVEDLVRVVGRVCTERDGSLTCYGGDAPTTLSSCGASPCGCSLVATSVISCEHELHARLDSQAYGQIAAVTEVAGPCAALVDGRVVCRGPAPNQRQDSEEIQALVTGKVPGILHTLALGGGE